MTCDCTRRVAVPVKSKSLEQSATKQPPTSQRSLQPHILVDPTDCLLTSPPLPHCTITRGTIVSTRSLGVLGKPLRSLCVQPCCKLIVVFSSHLNQPVGYLHLLPRGLVHLSAHPFGAGQRERERVRGL